MRSRAVILALSITLAGGAAAAATPPEIVEAEQIVTRGLEQSGRYAATGPRGARLEHRQAVRFSGDGVAIVTDEVRCAGSTCGERPPDRQRHIVRLSNVTIGKLDAQRVTGAPPLYAIPLSCDPRRACVLREGPGKPDMRDAFTLLVTERAAATRIAAALGRLRDRAATAASPAGVRRLEMTPGETLELAGDPLQDEAIYDVPARAGDTLVVRMQKASLPDDPRFSVRSAASGDTLEGRFEGEAIVLPATDTYRVQAHTNGRVLISLLPPTDPRVDPGIKPEDVALDARALNWTMRGSLSPILPEYASPGEVGLPARVELHAAAPEDGRDSYGGRLTVTLFPIAGFAAGGPVIDRTPQIAALRALLRPGARLDRADLTFFPQVTYRQDFAGAPMRMRFGCFDALRFVVRLTQEGDYPFTSLVYVALGISDDGKLLLSAAAWLDVPALPGIGPPPSAEPPYPAAWVARYRAALRDRLARAPDDFAPGIARLDAVMKTLTIPCSR